MSKTKDTKKTKEIGKKVIEADKEFDKNSNSDKDIDCSELLYEELLDIYENAKYKTLPDKCVKNTGGVKGRAVNISCGDDVTLGLVIEKNKVSEAGFDGHGCIISQAGASLLCDLAINKTVSQLKNLSQEEFLKAFPVKIPLHRQKCALTAFKALKNCLASLSKNNEKQKPDNK